MSSPCPVCGAAFADRDEAWTHFLAAHTDGPGHPAVAPPTPSSPTAGPVPGEPANSPPSQAGAAPSGGILRQGWHDGPATMTIIAVTVAAWLLDRGLHYASGIEVTHSLGGNGQLGTDGQWWRLVTPLLVHFGPLHIIFNMLWVYQLGPPIERLMGKVAFVGAYLATGIAGNVCSDLVYWHTADFLSGGASGAVYGLGGVLVGAWAVAKMLDRRRTGPAPPEAIAFNDQAVRSLAIFFGGYLVVAQIFIRHVDSAAHFGGGLLGLVIGAGLAWRHNGASATPVVG